MQAQTSADAVAPKAAPSGSDKPIHDVLAGALARAISQGTIHPIDTLKVRMQAGTKYVVTGGFVRKPALKKACSSGYTRLLF